jgi:hypothetical protein
VNANRLPKTSEYGDGGGLIDLTIYKPKVLDQNYNDKSASFPVCDFCNVQLIRKMDDIAVAIVTLQQLRGLMAWRDFNQTIKDNVRRLTCLIMETILVDSQTTYSSGEKHTHKHTYDQRYSKEHLGFYERTDARTKR